MVSSGGGGRCRPAGKKNWVRIMSLATCVFTGRAPPPTRAAPDSSVMRHPTEQGTRSRLVHCFPSFHGLFRPLLERVRCGALGHTRAVAGLVHSVCTCFKVVLRRLYM